jgi:hypothetical protein
MRDDLDGFSKIIASSLFLLKLISNLLQNAGLPYDDQFVNFAGGHIAIKAQLNSKVSDKVSLLASPEA